VDSIGVGAGVVDRLRELELPAVGVNVSENPALLNNIAYRMRDELWIQAKTWLEGRECVIPSDDRLQNELASIRKSFTSGGKIRVESKDDMKKRGLRSPDVADAFVMTFAFAAPLAGYMNANKYADWKKPLARNLEGSYV
jgi:hypothetical protein